MPDNIAQLEFVLVKTQSFSQIANEVYSRALDGKRIVLVVRIYDIRAALTSHVRYMQVLRVRREAYYRWVAQGYEQKPFWRRWLIERRRKRLAAQTLDARKKLVELALSALEVTIQRGAPVAIENDTMGPLRLVQQDELHELLETARRARSVRVFIFRHNDLLADRNKPVAYTF